MSVKNNQRPEPLRCKGEEQLVADEIKRARSNLDLILNTARDIANNSLLARYATSYRIQPLEDLGAYLSDVFDIILDKKTADLRTEATLTSRPLKLSDPAKVPFITLCPMTLCLQAIAQGLSELRVRALPNTWGSIHPLYHQLELLQSRLQSFSPNGIFHVGIAKCIMFHEEYGIYTVTSTAPTYKYLTGLDGFGKWLRYRHITKLKQGVAPDLYITIDERLKLSENISKDYAGRRQTKTERRYDQQSAVKVSGSGATFDSFGKYKVACYQSLARYSSRSSEH